MANNRMTAKTHWITEQNQVEALINPTRHDIVDRLTALGPMNVRALAQALGRQPTAIYRHLKLLEDAGLVRMSEGSQGERGRPSAVYYPIAKRIRLARAVGDPSLKKPIANFARMAGNQVARDYNRALGNRLTRIEGAERNLWLFRVVTTPSPKKLRRINQLLDELAELVWTPDPSPGPLLSIAWFLSPARQPAQRQASVKKG